MKKLLCAFLCAVLLFSAFSGCGGFIKPDDNKESETQKAETDNSSSEGKWTARVTATSNLRKSPDIMSVSLTLVGRDETVVVLEKNEEWTYVCFNGLNGYIYTCYLVFSDKPAEPEETRESETGDSSVSKETEKTGASEETETATLEDPETAAPTEETTETEEPGTKAEESSGETTETPTDSSEKDGNLVDNGLFPLEGLSNKSIPYGNNWDDKDATGLASGIHYYEHLYSKYYPVYRIKTDEKKVYLTMDEGYEEGYTPAILDTLKEKNVHAVFFVTKQFVSENPDYVRRMIDEGHIIGNHTCKHPSGGYPEYVDKHSLQDFVDDVKRLHLMVYEQFGYEMKLFRFPEGEASELLMAQIDNLGYTSVFWSYAHNDYNVDNQPTVEDTVEKCVNHLAPGVVFLLHAVSSANTYALPEIIDRARDLGYEFSDFPVSEVGKR